MRKKMVTIVSTLMMVVSISMTSLAGEWEKTDEGTRYKENGTYVTGWKWIPAFWEFNNQPGEGEWCYYFGDDGYLWTSTTTPDGNLLTGNGTWIYKTYIMNRRNGIVYYGGTDKVYNEESRRASEAVDKAFNEYRDSQDVEGGKAVDEWFGYEPDDVPKSSNDFLHGFYGQFTPNEKVELKDKITEFMENYINDEMSDFEKEMTIIQWLVENCKYEEGYVGAYNCIVKKKAQCAGYADAFLQMGKACGLEVRYVYNDYHAWNLIQLDGEWYHVDVTYEDPKGKNTYGFGNLTNNYINLDDEQIQKISYHKTWDSHGIEANGQEYGPEAVAEYLD